MGYVDNNLQKDEAVIAKAQFSYLSAAGSVIGSIVLFFLAIFIFILGKALGRGVQTVYTVVGILEILMGVGLVGLCILSIKCRELVVTNKRVIGKQGIIGARVVDVHIDKVDAISVLMPFFGQIFHYNSLRIESVGNNTGNNTFIGVKNANEIKNAINNAIEEHAAQARQSQANAIAEMMQKR